MKAAISFGSGKSADVSARQIGDCIPQLFAALHINLLPQ